VPRRAWLIANGSIDRKCSSVKLRRPGVADIGLANLSELVARLCISAVFLWSAITKSLDPVAGREEIVELGLPFPSFTLAATILCQSIGGLMVAIGFWARLGALVLAAFTLCATLVGHRISSVPRAQRAQEMTTGLEHLAIIGGFLMLAIYGAGTFSLDRLW
jgi:putative oxidoreductase